MIWGRLRRGRALAKRVLAAMRMIDPTLRARAVSDSTITIALPDGTKVQCSLDSLAEELRNREDPDRVIEHYARSMIAAALPMPDAVEVARILPMFKPSGWSEGAAPRGQQPLCFRVTDSIEMVLVEQGPDQLRFVADRHLGPSQIEATMLRDFALKNFSTLEVSIEAMPDVPLWLTCTPGQFSFNATLAIREDVWAEAARAAGEAVVCAVPERESCLFARASDSEALAKLRDRLVPHLHASSCYPVAQALLRLDGGRLAEYVP